MTGKPTYLILLGLLFGLVSSGIVEANDPNLVGLWEFEEGSGTVVSDSSGKGNDGTIEGAQWVDGYFGTALQFDGTNDAIRLGTGPSLDGATDFSVAAWIKTSLTAQGVIIQQRNGGYNGEYRLMVVAGGQLNLMIYGGGYQFSGLQTAATVNDGQWHHVAAVREGENGYLYIDGKRAASDSGTLRDLDNTIEVGIGADIRDSISYFNGIIDDVRVYDRALTQSEIQQAMKGIPLGSASGPNPIYKATDVPRDVVLNWTPGDFAPTANGHVVYLSENFNDVKDGIGGSTVSANSYDAGRLEFGTTYYWRIDEVNAPPDSTVYQGRIWSFTTEPVSYPVDGASITATASSVGQPEFGPENTTNGSGLDENDLHSTLAQDMWLSGNELQGAWIQYELDKVYKLHEMWVWNSNQTFENLFGFGLKDVTIEYSTDSVDWTVLAGVPQFAKAPGAPDYAHNTIVDLGGAVAKYVKLTATSNWGGLLPQYSLSEVRFFYVPVSAREPSPGAGASDVNPAVTLSWRAGREAGTHELYLSSDQQAVIDGNIPAVNVTEAGYSTSLDLAGTYYWRIDEVNDVETPATWQGDIWSFSTAKSLVVEDFESYNDIDPPDPESHRIFESWSDGFDDAANGALIGYDPPQPSYTETTIVHSGIQALPLFYSNTGGATSSETSRTFTVPQDWTQYGIHTLGLYFYGATGNNGQLYVKVNGVKVPYDGDAGNLATAVWQPWNIDLTALGVNLGSIMTLAIGIDGNGAAGTLYIDDIRLYAYGRELITPVQPDPVGLVGLWELDEDSGTAAMDSSGNGHHGTLEGNPQRVAGYAGNALQLGGSPDRVVVPYSAQLNPDNAFTVSVWANVEPGSSGYRSPITSRDDTPQRGYIIYAGSNGNWQFWIGNGSGWSQAAGPPIQAGEWTHVTGVYDNSELRLYINGIQAGQGSGTISLNTQAYLSIGAGATNSPQGNYFFVGMIDDTRVYNRVLSEAEIATLAGRILPFDKPL